MTTYELIRKLESLGALLSITNENRLKIDGVKNISADVLDAVKQRKEEIKSILYLDYKAKTKGWIVAIPGELYTLRIKQFRAVNGDVITMEVFIERDLEDKWTAWRETWSDNNKKSSYYVIVEGGSFRRALAKATAYVSYLKNRRRR